MTLDTPDTTERRMDTRIPGTVDTRLDASWTLADAGGGR